MIVRLPVVVQTAAARAENDGDKVMNKWQEGFVKKVEGLRDEAAKKFERVAGEVLERTYRKFADFTGRCEFQSDEPQSQKGLRTFKFALTEDAYVLIFFRLRGFDMVDCDYEWFVPTHGRVDGLRTTVGLHGVDEQWVERCFQMALDDFVSKFSECLHSELVAETVAV